MTIYEKSKNSACSCCSTTSLWRTPVNDVNCNTGLYRFNSINIHYVSCWFISFRIIWCIKASKITPVGKQKHIIVHVNNNVLLNLKSHVKNIFLEKGKI